MHTIELMGPGGHTELVYDESVAEEVEAAMKDYRAHMKAHPCVVYDTSNREAPVRLTPTEVEVKRAERLTVVAQLQGG